MIRHWIPFLILCALFVGISRPIAPTFRVEQYADWMPGSHRPQGCDFNGGMEEFFTCYDRSGPATVIANGWSDQINALEIVFRGQKVGDILAILPPVREIKHVGKLWFWKITDSIWVTSQKPDLNYPAIVLAFFEKMP